MQKTVQKEMDTLGIVGKRLEILVAARMRIKKNELNTLYTMKNRITNAIVVQDKLREKSEGWSGVKEIRKWREKRCSS